MRLGLSLRREWVTDLLREAPPLPFLEVVVDNVLAHRDMGERVLASLAERYPIVFHCLGANLGSTDPLPLEYLRRVRKLADRVSPLCIADHLCWTGVDGVKLDELLPLPFSVEAADHCALRLEQCCELLGRPLLVENVSRYVTLADDTCHEAEFVADVARRGGGGILLDLANVCVSAKNLGFDPTTYIQLTPMDLVGQMHISGYEDWNNVRVDTHSQPVPTEVTELLAYARTRARDVPVTLEWDRNIPPFAEVLRERERVLACAAAEAA